MREIITTTGASLFTAGILIVQAVAGAPPSPHPAAAPSAPAPAATR